MKKNIVVVLLMILGAMLIWGCVPQAPLPEAEEAPTPPPGKVELEWWTVQAGEQTSIGYWDYIIEEFEKKHPNVEVKRVDMIDEDFKTGLTSSMAAGIPPDLWFSWGGGILKAQVDAGHVADLTDLLNEPWAKEVVPRPALAQSTFDGKHYAFPFTIWVGHLYVNRELFDKYGLEVPKEPWSWDEFKEAIETFKANGVIPITVGGKEKWELSFYYMYLVDRIGGSEIFRKTINRVAGYTFEDPTFVQAGVRAEELAQIPTDRGRTNNLRLGLLLMT
ncbi:raffinose/stachyose/melibiose transport system substrate-binding protein [Candidatus Hakubella thermalkaliphila]|uniref:Raffinose/stachyose/melibiose transport system substrate-binding protein n=1 Tax=Candidatus Hakubella thermalkaliphila TaxID=2754717 RepID=A0A6V8PMR0_9ACTN|nr:raffinose/stachyose/melibiose transport system substrate-binding protein [Candidatus Hakubella thermalkaliphila]